MTFFVSNYDPSECKELIVFLGNIADSVINFGQRVGISSLGGEGRLQRYLQRKDEEYGVIRVG